MIFFPNINTNTRTLKKIKENKLIMNYCFKKIDQKKEREKENEN